MKKILTFVLVLAMIFTLMTGLASCGKGDGKTDAEENADADLSPRELFLKRWESLGLELCPVGNAGSFRIEDSNSFGFSAFVESPDYLKDAVNAGLEFAMDPEGDTILMDLFGKYRSSDVKVHVELDDMDDLFVSFPGTSDKFICGSLSEAAEGDYSLDDIRGMMTEYLESTAKMQEKMQEIIKKYVTDDNITVSVSDVTVSGETVKDAETVSLVLDRDDIISFVKEYFGIIRDFSEDMKDLADEEDFEGFGEFSELDDDDLDEIPEDAKLSATLFSSKGKVVRGEISFGAEDVVASAAVDVKYGDETEAIFAVTASEDGKTLLCIPARYTLKRDGDKFEGAFELLLKELTLPDGDGIAIDRLETLKLGFSGTAKDGEFSADLTLAVGTKGVTMNFPLKVSARRAGDRVDFSLSGEIKQLGVSAEIDMFVGRVEVLRGEYDAENGLDFNDETITDDDPGVQELISDLKAALSDVIEDFPQIGEYFDNDGETDDDGQMKMLIFDDDYSNGISLGSGDEGYFFQELEVIREDDDFAIVVGGDEFHFTLTDKTDKVELFGAEYDVQKDEWEGDTYYSIVRDDLGDSIDIVLDGDGEVSEANRWTDFTYVLEDGVLTVTLGGEEIEFDFEITGEDTVEIDGVEYSYFYVSEDSADDALGQYS